MLICQSGWIAFAFIELLIKFLTIKVVVFKLMVMRGKTNKLMVKSKDCLNSVILAW